MSELSAEDRDYWGVEDEDLEPFLPEFRVIGSKLFFRVDGKSHKLPLRLRAEYMEKLDELADNTKALMQIVTDYADDKTRAVVDGMDGLQRLHLVRAYFDGFRALAGAGLGESQTPSASPESTPGQ